MDHAYLTDSFWQSRLIDIRAQRQRKAERDCSSGLLPFLLSDRSDAHFMRGQERGSVTPVTLFTYFPSGSRLPPVVLAVGSATEFVTD